MLSSLTMFRGTLRITFLILVSLCLIPVLLGCASTADKENAGQYVDDTTITTKVKAALFNDQPLQASQISVDTYKGVVQLSGFVNSQESVIRAGQAAAGVTGVVSVKNDLIVK